MLEEANYYAYVTDDAGRSRGISAPAGFHDDLIIAHAIALHLLSVPDREDQAFAFMRRMTELVDGRVIEAAATHALPGVPHLLALPQPAVEASETPVAAEGDPPGGPAAPVVAAAPSQPINRKWVLKQVRQIGR
jgi:hypothetical protein